MRIQTGGGHAGHLVSQGEIGFQGGVGTVLLDGTEGEDGEFDLWQNLSQFRQGELLEFEGLESPEMEFWRFQSRQD